jgi:hypothetical protein
MPEHFKRLSLEGVMRASDDHPFREVPVVGSVWWCPSARNGTASYTLQREFIIYTYWDNRDREAFSL